MILKSQKSAMKLNLAQIALKCAPLLALFANSISAQVQDIYQINDGRFADHVEYKIHPISLAPGKELALGDLSGPGKVTYFYFTDSGAPGGVMYRGLVLKIYWDDATEPSIQIPIWDFFGAFGHKTIDYQSLPMQINHHCYMCYLPMPFSARARFVLLNDGNDTYSQLVAWGIDYERNAAFRTESSRLHAAWQRSYPARTHDSAHTMLDIVGRGQYVGNFLQVNTEADGWWGEGLTMFNVDGEESRHSNGSEDEYGSCWGFGHTFSYPYSGYIQMDEGKNRMYRWYLMNPVRFQKSLRVQILAQTFENGEKAPSKDTSAEFTSVAFWYQDGAHPAPTLPSYADRVNQPKTLSKTGQ